MWFIFFSHLLFSQDAGASFIVSWQPYYWSHANHARRVMRPPSRMHKPDDVILLLSSRSKRGKWGGAAANPNRSRSVWVIQAGCGGFRDGPNPVKGCHWKVWIVSIKLNTKRMAGWQSDYLKAVSHISLCVWLVPASRCSVTLQVDCLLMSLQTRAYMCLHGANEIKIKLL